MENEKVVENFKLIAEKFAPAMETNTGKNVLVKDVITSVEKFVNGEYKTLQEMYQKNNFTAQNAVYDAINKGMIKLGTPLSSLSRKNRNTRLPGNVFALKVLEELSQDTVQE